MTAENVRSAFAQARDYESRLKADTLAQFLAREIPPRRLLLSPWLPEKGLALLYSWRGVGKTWAACSISYAVASGGRLFGWEAATPRRVLHIDGEMPGADLQQRFAGIIKGANTTPPNEDYLRIIAADLIPEGIPDLATREGQEGIAEHLDGVDLVVLDNLSTLVASLRENEADDWGDVQRWLVSLRRQGKSVLILHHSGKGGQQRGTSRREDALDSVIALKRPDDYRPEQGARFEVRFEKTRGVFGPEARPFEAVLDVRDGAACWLMKDAEARLSDRIAALAAEGLTQRDIARELGIGLSTVNRHLKRRGAAGGTE